MRAVRRASISGSSSAPGTAQARVTSEDSATGPTRSRRPLRSTTRRPSRAPRRGGASPSIRRSARWAGAAQRRASRRGPRRPGAGSRRPARSAGRASAPTSRQSPLPSRTARHARSARGPRFEVGHHRARRRRRPSERVHHRRAGELGHEGQQVVTNAIAEEARVAIARVLHPGEPAAAQVRLDGRPRASRSAGRIRSPRTGAMPPSPRGPAPCRRRISTVSAWSSAVWPVATRVAPIARATRSSAA